MDAPPTPLSNSTGYLLFKAGHYIGLELEAALASLELTTREFQVLSFAAASDGLSQQDISARLGVDPTIVVGLVDALEGRGWLNRARDPEDRRRNQLAVTPQGIEACNQALRTVAEAEERFLAPLAADEREQLNGMVQALLRGRLPWLS